MKMRNYLIMLFSFTTMLAHAQNAVGPDTKKLVQDAIAKDYEYRNQKLESSKTTEDIKKAKETYLPRVNALGGYAYLNNKLLIDLPTLNVPLVNYPLFAGDKTFKTHTNLEIGALNAQMVLFSGLQVPYGTKALMMKQQAEEHMAEAKRRDIAQDVLTTVDQIALLKQSKILLDESEKRLEKEILRVNKAIANGLAIPYDRKRIEVAKYQLASKQEEYDGKRALLYSRLSMLTGHSEQELSELDVELQPWIVEEKEAGNVEDRPEVKALNAGIQATDFQIKMQRAKVLPQVVALGSLSYANLHGLKTETSFTSPITQKPLELNADKVRMNPGWVLGVGIKWDIFTGLSRTRDLNKLYIDRQIAENRQKDINEKLDLLKEKSLIEYRMAKKQVELKNSERELSKSTLEIATKSYIQGLIPVSERLATETSYQQAQLDYLQAVFNQRKAAIDYLKAGGNFSVESL